MKKRRIVLDLKDTDYKQHLQEFLSKYYPDTFETMEPSEEPFTEGIIDIWVSDQEMKNSEIPCLTTLYMAEEGGIDPYRSGHEIVRDMMVAIIEKERELEKERLQKMVEDAEEKSPVWLYDNEENGSDDTQNTGEDVQIPKRCFMVCASAGGIGCSLAGRALAECMGDFGRTLYIELSSTTDWKTYFDCDETEGGLSDLIYSFLSEPREIWEERIEEFAVKQTSGIFFVRSVLYPDDLWTLDKMETEGFIDGLLRHFDTVVLETGKLWLPFSYCALSRVDRLWIMIPQGTDPERERFRIVPRQYEGELTLLMREKATAEKSEKNPLKAGFTSRIFAGKNHTEENVYWIPWMRETEEDKGRSGREETEKNMVKEVFLPVIREAVRQMG